MGVSPLSDLVRVEVEQRVQLLDGPLTGGGGQLVEGEPGLELLTKYSLSPTPRLRMHGKGHGSNVGRRDNLLCPG